MDKPDRLKLAADPKYIKDSDGPAKVALIGIDRSIAAWEMMLSFHRGKLQMAFTFLPEALEAPLRKRRAFPVLRPEAY